MNNNTGSIYKDITNIMSQQVKNIVSAFLGHHVGGVITGRYHNLGITGLDFRKYHVEDIFHNMGFGTVQAFNEI